MNVNLTLTKDYRKNDCLAPQKTNPIKPCPELAEALSAAEGAVEWANFKCSLAQILRFAKLERRVAMAHLKRYWQTKWSCQINSLRKVVQKC